MQPARDLHFLSLRSVLNQLCDALRHTLHTASALSPCRPRLPVRCASGPVLCRPAPASQGTRPSSPCLPSVPYLRSIVTPVSLSALPLAGPHHSSYKARLAERGQEAFVDLALRTVRNRHTESHWKTFPPRTP